MSCSQHGVFAHSKCNCITGYSGPECDLCAEGYYGVGTYCLPNDKKCTPEYCGCDGTNCRGTCFVKGDALACQCNAQFDGDRCEVNMTQRCASGYLDFPSCTQALTCTCVHGECNVRTGHCTCPVNFYGETCDRCSDGWSGSDCGTQRYNLDNAYTGLEVAGVIIGLVVIGVGIFFMWRARKLHGHASVQDIATQNVGVRQLPGFERMNINGEPGVRGVEEGEAGGQAVGEAGGAGVKEGGQKDDGAAGPAEVAKETVQQETPKTETTAASQVEASVIPKVEEKAAEPQPESLDLKEPSDTQRLLDN